MREEDQSGRRRDDTTNLDTTLFLPLHDLASELVFPDPDGAVKARKRTVQDRFAELLHSSLPPPPLFRPPSSNSPSTEEGKKEDGTVNDGKTVDTSLLFSTIKTRRCLEKGNKLLRQLLSVVVSACADVHLGAQARKLARGLGIHFLLVMATHTEKLKKAVGNTEKDEKEEDMQLENMPGQAPEETSAEVRACRSAQTSSNRNHIVIALLISSFIIICYSTSSILLSLKLR